MKSPQLSSDSLPSTHLYGCLFSDHRFPDPWITGISVFCYMLLKSSFLLCALAKLVVLAKSGNRLKPAVLSSKD